MRKLHLTVFVHLSIRDSKRNKAYRLYITNHKNGGGSVFDSSAAFAKYKGRGRDMSQEEDKKLRRERLLEKANELPLCPGVYVMKQQNGKVIYVGKSKKLKNRVSQYFQNSTKSVKTERMVASVWDFDYYICNTEIEALSLENTLIKQYSPRYNIKLKDAKSYPYIKITKEEYPRVVFTRKREGDKAGYFGPYTGTSTVFSIMGLLQKTLGLPSCNRKFPKDIGKERPCVYYQMHQCCGVCTGEVSPEEYGELIKCACDILRGNTFSAKQKLEAQMMEYAEKELFEAAVPKTLALIYSFTFSGFFFRQSNSNTISPFSTQKSQLSPKTSSSSPCVFCNSV